MVDRVAKNQAEEEAEASYNTADPIQVNKARKKAARTRADRLQFVKAAMQHEQGRAWFYDIIVRCHVFNTPFDDDPYRHAYRAGEANIGLQILDDIQVAAPEHYLQMITENKSNNG